MGRLDEAIELSRESLEVSRRVFGSSHPTVARSMSSLGIWMLQDSDPDSAESLFREALTLQSDLLGSEHSEVGSSMSLLANLLIETERFQEAHTVAAEAHRIQLQSLGADHWRTAAAASAEGAALSGLGRHAEAEELLLQSFATLQREADALPLYVNNTTRWLADLYKNSGESAKAQKYLAMLDANKSE